MEESSEGRITVRHTLTDFEVEGKEEEVSSDYWLPGRHYHFTSQVRYSLRSVKEGS